MMLAGTIFIALGVLATRSPDRELSALGFGMIPAGVVLIVLGAAT